ncbi:type II toxin-antitoxin system HipA family toxin [Synoicihabitans lomoniglobus]|uniref:Type II toxin-antitoxin system HipA family toxin n=1 Tax=Synoicihabitans lomoniglobus TaxID=2909285 RepID=A0AAF0I3J4_9BACT|nr:type II toxin-antitoxin system HipA family toxin [Opitutaceae bacterium LMO-M01]WED66179.1 type II toxin-antitoxin system HipA family toxin [Opitutaceae bacterium LMO-M01]
MANPFVDVYYGGTKAGVAYWDVARRAAAFEYTPKFVRSGVELAPLMMPLRTGPYQFTNLPESFGGLPGLLADSLPDTYGNALIDDWLRSEGRSPTDFSPVERLCYIGNRGMGALEFRPSLRERNSKSERLEVDRLVELASAALARREGLSVGLGNDEDLNEILRVGTSAGGARAKAVVALNPSTGEVRSGQAKVPAGFEHWLMKFDGVTASFDGVRDPQGYGRIEYAYHLMARQAGIAMAACRLFEEGGRAHFMTRRFDRPDATGKRHFASLFGVAHMAYAAPGAHGHAYEDYFDVIEKLHLAPVAKLEGFRRMVFNVLGCNRDDHTKNFGFMLNGDDAWELSPAYDVSYAHNPQPGKWTATQQMSVAGKRENITRADFITIGRNCRVATVPKLNAVIDEVAAALEQWERFADQAGVAPQSTAKIDRVLRAVRDAAMS